MKFLWLAAAFIALPTPGFASGLDRCEIVVASEVIDADGGRMTVASYRSADSFLTGVYDPAVPLSLKADGAPIKGLICVRNDLVPTEQDYAVLATGVPLSISQDFDSPDSDILTLYYGKRSFLHKYTSDYPMSPEFKAAVQERLSDFSSRDHGLVKLGRN